MLTHLLAQQSIIDHANKFLTLKLVFNNLVKILLI